MRSPRSWARSASSPMAGPACSISTPGWKAMGGGRSCAALRARGVAFALTLKTRIGRLIEVDGQAIGGRAVLRLRNVSGIRHELGELMIRYRRQMEEAEALRTLVEEASAPIWTRDAAGRLAYANKAYVRAVAGRDAGEVIERGIELFDRGARASLLRAQAAAQPYAGQAAATVMGAPR